MELDLKNLKTMDEVWTLLEREYGQVHKLTNELVSQLMQFTVLKEAKTEAQQFTELQRKWTQVVKDLQEVEEIKCLNNPFIIQSISRKLPRRSVGISISRRDWNCRRMERLILKYCQLLCWKSEKDRESELS